MADHDPDQTLRDFEDAVNMSASALEKWLATDESKEVGQKKDGSGESTGHEMGREIVALLKKKKADHAEDDYAAMRKVVGYVHRHLAQGGPEHDAEHSRWRYSLMNWGHDPLEK